MARLTKRAQTILIVSVSFVLFFCMAGNAFAAEKITVRSVDSSKYPDIELRVMIQSAHRPESLTVIEDHRTVGVSSLNALASQSLSTVLLLDLSNSMRGEPLEGAKSAAIQFVNKMGGKQETSLVTFATKVEQRVGFTTDKALMSKAIKDLEVEGKTSLYDGVRFSIDRLSAQSTDRKALVILSDGDDSSSSSTLEQVAAYSAKKGIPVYAIAMKSSGLNIPALAKLTAAKGRLVSDVTPQALSGVFSLMAAELKNTYTIKFTSESKAQQTLVELYAPAGPSVLRADTLIKRPKFTVAPKIDVPAESQFEVGFVSAPTAVILVAGILSFLGLAILIVAVFLKPRKNQLEETLEYYGALRPHELADGGAIESNRMVKGVIDLVSRLADKRGFTKAVRQLLEAAGLPLNTREYITLHVLIVLAVSLLALSISGNSVTGAIFAVISALLPIVTISYMARRRAAKLTSQLPDVLGSLAGLLRAGYGLMQGIESLVDSSPAPMKTELAKVTGQVAIGIELEHALAKMAARVQSNAFSWLVVAININRETGGNLAELLDKLADNMRKQQKFRRQVASLAAEGKLSTVILMGMPFLVMAALTVLSPNYLSELFDTTMGNIFLGFSGLLMTIGYFWMRRVAQVEV